MRIFKINVGYYYLWGNETDEDYPKKKAEYDEKIIRRAELFTDLRIEINRRKNGDIDWSHLGEIIVNEHQLLQLTIAGEEVKITGEVPVPEEDSSNVSSAVKKLTRLVHKLLESPLNDPRQESVWNERLNIHVPGPALHTYNDVLLLEDSCTDILQESLNKGWRIIACCPQAQRRPDYILGRFNLEFEPGYKAAKRDPNEN